MVWNCILKVAIAIVLALVLVEAQLDVSSDYILLLHDSSTEIVITYTQPIDKWPDFSAEALRANDKSFVPPIIEPSVVNITVAEDLLADIKPRSGVNSPADTIDILTKEERDTTTFTSGYYEPNTLLKADGDESFGGISGRVRNKISENQNETKIPSSKEYMKLEETENNTPFQINLANNISKEISNDKLAQEIQAILADAKNMASKTNQLLNAIKVLNSSLETNSRVTEATNLPKENSSTPAQEKPVSVESVNNRGKRSLESEIVSMESIESAESKRTIAVTVNSDRELAVSRNLLEVNDSLTVQSWRIKLYGRYPGNVVILIQLDPSDPRVSDVVVHVDIERAHILSIASNVMGWIYFTGWGISAYCQVYYNWQRKSVVGLNFDYLGLNMIGHSLYGVYNYVLFSSRPIQEEFFLRNPFSANPIQINDVAFSMHNSLITLFTIFQCLIYERGNQRLSVVATFIFTLYAAWLFFAGFLALLHRICWLDFINQCALIKFTVTLIKYAPQAYMNFRRKSTVGWSIGNVLLDLIGGFFSLMQMIVLAYNFDDWYSLLTDTTKLGLAVFTLMFDFLFIVQHYILYPHQSNCPTSRDLRTYEKTVDIESSRESQCYTNQVIEFTK